MIDAVIWDLGGVILRTEDTSARQIWEERFAMKPWDLERLVFGNPVSQQATRGEASSDDVWKFVQESLRISDDELHSLRFDFFEGDQVDAKLMDLIYAIKAKCKTGLITNAWPDARQLIEDELQVAGAFNEIIISAEVRVAKPDPEIYRMMLEKIDLIPERTLFIDDFIENIDGAKAVGMHALLFTSSDDTITKLSTHFRLNI
jgi:epoxide hydrolase-like predicted phosphatase